jgi:uncharacterized RDD family membrane protein YckC
MSKAQLQKGARTAHMQGAARATKVQRRQAGPTYGSYAGFASRTMAMVIDLLIIISVFAVAAIVLEFFYRTSALENIVGWIQPWLVGWGGAFAPVVDFLLGSTFRLLALFGFAQLYFTLFYVAIGATPGKYLIGLRVVTRDGRPPRMGGAALRTLAYAASALPLYLGFLAVLVDNRRRGWHDRIAKTYVVHSWEARPAERFLRGVVDRLHGDGSPPA